MGKSIRVEMNSAGARELLRDAGVGADLERRARAIASAAGPGFEVITVTGAQRVRSSVRPTTAEAVIAEARNKVLTRAIDKGR